MQPFPPGKREVVGSTPTEGYVFNTSPLVSARLQVRSSKFADVTVRDGRDLGRYVGPSLHVSTGWEAMGQQIEKARIALTGRLRRQTAGGPQERSAVAGDP